MNKKMEKSAIATWQDNSDRYRCSNQIAITHSTKILAPLLNLWDAYESVITDKLNPIATNKTVATKKEIKVELESFLPSISFLMS